VKENFPIFANNPGLVYLDNAATTQKPQSVINSIVEYYSKFNANVHRGLYPLSDKSTQLYEEARQIVADFIKADTEEVIFVGGTTDGVNAIATGLSKSKLVRQNPIIITSEFEHHSNILPWQGINPSKIYYMKKVEDNVLEYFDNTKYQSNNESPDIITLSYVSNVTGTIFPIKDIANETNSKYKIIDAAQAIGHMPIDVKNLNIDFMVFSGHKMYGPTGIGVIYAKKEILEKMEPFRVGGGMINKVERDNATWASLPTKFEAGTPPISEAIALGEAIKFIKRVGFEYIQKHEQGLLKYLLIRLQEISEISIYHPMDVYASGVVSISIKGVHPHDLAQSLGNNSICVRAGHHCTQILHREILQIPASLRISLAVYNDHEDIDIFIFSLKKIINTFKK